METESQQLRRYIIAPVLTEMGMYSRAAENLLIGTAAHESNGFKAIHQYGEGPARSMYQIEMATHEDLWVHTIPGLRRSQPRAILVMENWIAKRYAGQPAHDYLMYSVVYATAIARLLYWRSPMALPDADDINGLAHMYKVVWNTKHGAATPADFVDAYNKHCRVSAT